IENHRHKYLIFGASCGHGPQQSEWKKPMQGLVQQTARIAAMRWLIGILLALFLGLQYRLWWGEGGSSERARLEAEVAAQQDRNRELEARNRKLADEVDLLKSGVGVEERA